MRIVTRTEAGLAVPRKAIPPGPSTRRRLFLHHSVTPLSSDPLDDWRKVQAAAFGRGFADISYTWGIHLPSRCVLAGRSPHVVGAHTEGFNDTAHAIVLIGNYENDSPMNLDVIGELRAELVRAGWLTSDHIFQPHRTVQQTACPGSKIVARWADITTNQGDDMTPDQAQKLEEVHAMLSALLTPGRLNLGDVVNKTLEGVGGPGKHNLGDLYNLIDARIAKAVEQLKD